MKRRSSARGAVVVIAALAGASALLIAILPTSAVRPVPTPLELFRSMGTGRALRVRLHAALTVLDDPAAYHPLLVRSAVGLAGQFGDERAEDGLATIVASGIATGGPFDDHTRMASANALGRIGGSLRFPSVATATAPPLGEGVPVGRGSAPGRGGSATRCPGSSSPPPCPPPGAATRSFRGYAEETVDALLACAVPGDARRVRMACIQALGRGRVEVAVPTLEFIADDPDEDAFVVVAALRALSQIVENNHVTDAALNAALTEAYRYFGRAP